MGFLVEINCVGDLPYGCSGECNRLQGLNKQVMLIEFVVTNKLHATSAS
jgi:hypothetical protein